MDIIAETTTPATVCIHVCLPSSTLDQAIAGVKTKSNQRKERFGKRKMRVKKRSVEYVICPLIFQKRETMVRMVEVVREAMVTVDMVGSLRMRVLMTKRTRKASVMIEKKRGLSSLLVNS